MSFSCENCGAKYPKWEGKCAECGEWGSLVEISSDSNGPLKGASNTDVEISKLKNSSEGESVRKSTKISELDRVLGGGYVAGQVVLVSGDPGVGKSTLLTKLSLEVAKEGLKVLYVCGEESVGQVSIRVDRFGFKNVDKLENFDLTQELDVEKLSVFIRNNKYDLVVIDSIQTLFSSSLTGYAGGVSQVKASAASIINVAKSTGVSVFMVGQVSKTGNVAGPKILEHSVDTVLYMEGDPFHSVRMLRPLKNRFGSTSEIGVFQFTVDGIEPVDDPSEIFLQGSGQEAGSVVCGLLHGSRVVFVEIQALVIERESEGGPLRRVANGVRKPRLDMLCAVMSKRGGVFLGDKDVFVNVSSGLNISSPAVDLAICVAIKSSYMDKVVGGEKVYLGEVGLTGVVKPVFGQELIVKEASRLGYKVASMSKQKGVGINIEKVSQIKV